MISAKKLITDAIHLFYPHNCCGCGSDLLPADDLLCLKCFSILPYTGFYKHPGNPVENIFRGRIPVKAAHATFYFSKGQLVQHLVHELKYKANRGAGIWLGKIMGKELLQSERFSQLDYLVPLPLFPDKEFKRGYNQAEMLCNGMSETMHTPVLSKNLVRNRFTQTQTKKHRTERWENVAGSFAVNKPGLLQGKSILLVDDVLTTGASIEAACIPLLKIPNISISIAILAIASK